MVEKNRVAFLVGMPRAATTFLYHNLKLHPDLFIPYRRKTNYFSLHHDKGEHWFLSHFKDMSETSIAIDTETLAFINSELNSPQLIKEFNKDTKIILCVRDPVAWVVSLYDQIATFDEQIPSFESYLAGNYTLIEDGIGTIFQMPDGAISARVGEYERLFPNSILLLKFRDVTEFPLESLRKIEQFLGISSFFNSTNIITKKINSSDRKHSKFLNKILRNQYLISFVRMVLPRKVVLLIRWIFDNLSSGDNGKPGIGVDHEEKKRKLSLAARYYESDVKALERYIK